MDTQEIIREWALVSRHECGGAAEESWEHIFCVGRMQRDAPRGLAPLSGVCDIAKWRNLTRQEKAELYGAIVRPSGLDGPALVYLNPAPAKPCGPFPDLPNDVADRFVLACLAEGPMRLAELKLRGLSGRVARNSLRRLWRRGLTWVGRYPGGKYPFWELLYGGERVVKAQAANTLEPVNPWWS